MKALHQDFRDLLSAFANESVSYLLIGGYAVSFYSRPRYTKDIDLWIANDPQNLERVHRALVTFGAPPHLLADLRALAPDEILFMGVPPVRVDLLQEVSGLEFGAAFARRLESSWEGTPVSIVGLEDLITAKRAAGRPQDLIDAAELEKIVRG